MRLNLNIIKMVMQLIFILKIYKGERIDKKREGKGICTLPDGDKYDGEWYDGKKDGTGL